MKRLLIIMAFIGSLHCISCHNSSEKKQNADSLAVAENKTTLTNQKLQPIACFFAGLPVDSSSEFYPLSKSSAWVDYQKKSEEMWGKFNTHADKVRQWAKQEIHSRSKNFKTVFYPFSGPDFLFVNIMFPNAEKIYMFGLEPLGTVPDSKKISKENLGALLEQYKTAISDVTSISFFRTKDMKKELTGAELDGTTPILMLFLARSGKTVTQVEMKEINKEGKLIALSSHPTDNKVVQITYRNPGETIDRQLIYYSGNVIDSALKANEACRNFLGNIESGCGVYVKSASYLMHNPYFSMIRTLLLDKAALLIQDDSGIPFRYFGKEKWNIKLYGSYVKPISLFKSRFQQDLFDAYSETGNKPLSFRIGYNKNSNILVAEKVKP